MRRAVATHVSGHTFLSAAVNEAVREGAPRCGHIAGDSTRDRGQSICIRCCSVQYASARPGCRLETLGSGGILEGPGQCLLSGQAPTHPLAFLLVMDGAVPTAIVSFRGHNSPGENSRGGERRHPRPSTIPRRLSFMRHSLTVSTVFSRAWRRKTWLIKTGGFLFDSFFRAQERVPSFLGGHVRHTQGSAVTTKLRPACAWASWGLAQAPAPTSSADFH